MQMLFGVVRFDLDDDRDDFWDELVEDSRLRLVLRRAGRFFQAVVFLRAHTSAPNGSVLLGTLFALNVKLKKKGDDTLFGRMGAKKAKRFTEALLMMSGQGMQHYNPERYA